MTPDEVTAAAVELLRRAGMADKSPTPEQLAKVAAVLRAGGRRAA